MNDCQKEVKKHARREVLSSNDLRLSNGFLLSASPSSLAEKQEHINKVRFANNEREMGDANNVGYGA